VNIVIQLVAPAHTGQPFVAPIYVRDFDPDGNHGRGTLKTTVRAAEAKQFASIAEAHDFWRQQSSTHPLRDDGKPNRPLTAYTVSIFSLDVPPERRP
jgi:hypothetical protein